MEVTFNYNQFKKIFSTFLAGPLCPAAVKGYLKINKFTFVRPTGLILYKAKSLHE